MSRRRSLQKISAALRLLLTFALASASVPSAVRASVPAMFNFQGKLADSSGAPQTGSFTMSFRVFDAPSGGSLLTTYTPGGSVAVSNGLFNVLVGDTSGGGSSAPLSLGQALAAAGNLYLEVVVNGTPVTRQRLLSAPFSMSLADGSVTDASVAAGAGLSYSKLNLSSSIVNGDLAGGSYPGITGLGIVTSGTWNGATVSVAHGGTGATTPGTALASLGAAASTTTFSAGTALTGGGSLAANRTISLNLDATPGCGTAATGKVWWDTGSVPNTIRCGTDAAGTGLVTGSGTVGTLAKWSGAAALANSALTDNGTTVSVGEAVTVAGNAGVTGNISASGTLSGASLSLGTLLSVSNGGTGASTFTLGGILLGNGTSAVSATPVLGNGQLLIGNGAGAPTPATLAGTANQVSVVNGAGTITLSLPQDVHTGASPTFAGLTLSSPLGVASGGTGANTLTAHGVVVGNGTTAVNVSTSGVVGDVFLSGGAAADPRWGRVANANLAGGAYPAITGLGTVASGTWQGTAVDATHGGTGQTTVAAGDLLRGGTNAWSRLGVGSNGQVLTVAAGILSWQTPPTRITGAGTSGTIPRWNGAGATTTITNSILTDDGTTVTAAGALAANSLTLTTTPLAASSGGTGIGSYTALNYLNAVGATTLQQRTPAQVRGDVGAAASGANADITSLTGLSTALPPTEGGTGLSSLSAGDILFGSAANVWGLTSIGTTGRVLTVSGGVPAWLPPQGASGSGLSGRGAFWSSVDSTSLTSDGSFIWDNINKRLGIGGAPSWPVQVNGSGNIPYLTVTTISSINKRARLQFTQNGDGGWELGRDALFNNGDDLYFYNRSTGAFGFQMESNGNVGVGMGGGMVPEQILHVNGDLEMLTTGIDGGFRFRERGSGSALDDWKWFAIFDNGHATTYKALLTSAGYTNGDPEGFGANPNELLNINFATGGGQVEFGGLVTDSNVRLKANQGSASLAGVAVDLEGNGGEALICTNSGGGCNFSSLSVSGFPAKTFVIPHPVDPAKYLVHATLEGPEGAVFYEGTARLKDGQAWVTLPDYFEALTRVEGRTVQLTPVSDGDEPLSGLAHGPVEGGKFLVKTVDGKRLSQEFNWEVKAVRKDVAPLVVEPAKSDVEVAGDGPYTYIKSWKKK